LQLGYIQKHYQVKEHDTFRLSQGHLQQFLGYCPLKFIFVVNSAWWDRESIPNRYCSVKWCAFQRTCPFMSPPNACLHGV